MADRLIALTERVAVLEARQFDATPNLMTPTANLYIPANYCLVLESLELADGITLEIASGGSLVLIG